SSTWSSFAPASMAMPEVSLCRDGERSFLTANAFLTPGDDPSAAAERLRSRLTALRFDPLPMLDPAPAGRPEISSARPPGDFERAVAAATEMIGAGEELTKVVLAREVVVTAAAAHD